jgi:hypothetical protein
MELFGDVRNKPAIGAGVFGAKAVKLVECYLDTYRTQESVE